MSYNGTPGFSPDIQELLDRVMYSPECSTYEPQPGTVVPNVGAVIQHQTRKSTTTVVLSPEDSRELAQGARVLLEGVGAFFQGLGRLAQKHPILTTIGGVALAAHLSKEEPKKIRRKSGH